MRANATACKHQRTTYQKKKSKMGGEGEVEIEMSMPNSR